MNQRAYMSELQEIIFSFPEDRRRTFVSTFAEQEKNPVVSYVLNAFLGSFGFDMFYLGKPILGIVKLLTFGAGGIWSIVNLFFIAGMTRKINIITANEIKNSLQRVN